MSGIARGRTKEYEGEGITVRYEARRCIHAGECVKGLGAVFDPDRRPWIDPSRAEADEIAAVVRRCPTGALTYSRTDGGGDERIPPVNRARVSEDGPLFLHGNLEIRDGRDEPVPALRLTRAALCRCGHSSNKPFCDDSHWEEGFTDPGTFEVDDSVRPGELPESGRGGDGHGPAAGQGEGDGEGANGKGSAPEAPLLVLTIRPDASIGFAGPLEIVSADGTTATLREKGSLCRCGESKRKPFCDATHRDVGFVGD